MIQCFNVFVATPTVLTTFGRQKTRKTQKCETEGEGRQPVRFHAWYDDGTSRVDNFSLFWKNGKLVKNAVSRGYSDDSRLAGPGLKRVFYSCGLLL